MNYELGDISFNMAAIDIGSNGARLLIKNFFRKDGIGDPVIKRVMYMRVPLRLGKDVFSLGKISKERQEKMLYMLKAFKQIMKLNDVVSYRAAQSEYGADIPLTVLGIVMKVFQIIIAITIGMSAGCIPIVSYNYGAKRFDRCRGVLWRLTKPSSFGLFSSG